MPYRDIERRRAYDRERAKFPHRRDQARKYAATHSRQRTKAARLWKLKNSERAQTWYGAWKGTSKYLLSKAKARAKTLGLEFTITICDIPVPKICPVLGIPLVSGTKFVVDGSPSVDRIRLDKGYVPGNVRVISWRANRLKSNATIKEIEQVLRYLKRERAC